MEPTWHWKSFQELTNRELYEIIQIREKVFVVEQKISYVDCDGHDQDAWHLFATIDNKIVAYLRAFPAGKKYVEASFGRVLTDAHFRGLKLGQNLTMAAIQRMTQTFGPSPIRISAQAHLKSFYQKFGFQPDGEEYIEEGIPHLKMLKP